MSINEIMASANKVKESFKLQPDQSVLLKNSASPLATLVGVTACIDARAQLVIPDAKSDVDELQSKEQVTAKLDGI